MEIDYEKAIYIFKEHPGNARGIFKQVFGVNDKEFEQAEKLYRSGGMIIEGGGKKRKRATGINEIKKAGHFVDTASKNIAVSEEVTEEIQVKINRLRDNHGYTVTQKTFK